MKWQPIETSPKSSDGHDFMLLAWPSNKGFCSGEGFHTKGRFFAVAYLFKGNEFPKCDFKRIEVQPTHWMPLPPAPEEATKPA